MSLSAFDGIIYINLDHRIDRNESFLKEMERLEVDTKNLHRISAFNDPLNGIRGCLISHINALRLIETKGWKRGLILEDDCIFSKSLDIQMIDNFFKHVKEDWDVFLLGGKYFEIEEAQWKSIMRIRKSLRSHAYSINRQYISTLLSCFEEALEIIKDDTFFIHSQYQAVDRVWHKLQQKDRWFAFEEVMAFQRPSYSDIAGHDKLEDCLR